MNRKNALNIIRYLIRFMAWFCLSWFCFIIMIIIVFVFGNPLLPIPSLAQHGWAWHHIPEILGFLFSGIWFGNFKILGQKFGLRDLLLLLFLLTVSTLIPVIAYSLMLDVVIKVATLPSIIGYLIKRWYTIKKANSSF